MHGDAERASVAVRLDAYLSAHFTEKLNAVKIAGYLAIGKTRLYKLSQQFYGRAIAEKMRNLRMEKTKELLSGQSSSRYRRSPHCAVTTITTII